MNKEQAIKALLDAMNGFHGRFKKIYGQVAMRIDDETYLTTGGNKLLSEIVEDDLIICDISDGDIAQIFRKRPDINAFIFGCSQDTVEVSNELDVLPCSLEDIAQLAGPEIPITLDAKPETLLAHLRDCKVCLVKGVGAVAVSSDVRGVVSNLHILHKACEAYLHGKMLGGQKPLDAGVATWLKETYKNNYLDTNEASHVEYIGHDEDEFAQRTDIIEYGKHLIKDDLAYGCAGDLSVRFGENEMLISPSSMDYFDIRIEDVVKIDIDSLEYGDQRVPSSDAEIHAAMYKALPGCNAIIHTHSNACSVFAACEAGFAISDPNMQALIGDIKIVPYTPDAPDSTIANLLSTLSTTHAAILPHHGTIFYGPSLELVYEIAKSVEMLARNILQYDAKPEEI